MTITEGLSTVDVIFIVTFIALLFGSAVVCLIFIAMRGNR